MTTSGEPADVSVVIPLHNERQSIERALRSVAVQTCAPREVIVVDDGSTDGGEEIVCTFPAVTIARQPWAGPGAARNRGVAIARGDWIAFLDADDEWRPEFLARTVDAARRLPGAPAVFTNMARTDGHAPLRSPRSGAHLVEDYFQFILDNRGHGMSSSTTLVSRKAFFRCGGFPTDIRRGEDLDLWVRLAWSGPVAFVPEELAVYHVDTAPDITGHGTQPFSTFLQTYTTWRDSGRIPPALAAASRRFAAWLCLQYVAAFAYEGDPRAARRILAEAHAVGVLPAHAALAARMRLLLPTTALHVLRRLKQRVAPRG